MILIIFFAIIFICMIIENMNIKKDVNANKKCSFTKNDASYYYKNYLK